MCYPESEFGVVTRLGYHSYTKFYDHLRNIVWDSSTIAIALRKVGRSDRFYARTKAEYYRDQTRDDQPQES
jgi:hypothetical protein